MGEGKAAWQRSCCAFLVRQSGVEVRLGCSCLNLASGSADVPLPAFLPRLRQVASASRALCQLRRPLPRACRLTDLVLLSIWDIQPIRSGRPSMDQGAVFQSNRSQAVRLPNAVSLPEDVKRVDVVAVGRARIIAPVGESWDFWFEGRVSRRISWRNVASPPSRSVSLHSTPGAVGHQYDHPDGADLGLRRTSGRVEVRSGSRGAHQATACFEDWLLPKGMGRRGRSRRPCLSCMDKGQQPATRSA